MLQLVWPNHVSLLSEEAPDLKTVATAFFHGFFPLFCMVFPGFSTVFPWFFPSLPLLFCICEVSIYRSGCSMSSKSWTLLMQRTVTPGLCTRPSQPVEVAGVNTSRNHFAKHISLLCMWYKSLENLAWVVQREGKDSREQRPEDAFQRPSQLGEAMILDFCEAEAVNSAHRCPFPIGWFIEGSGVWLAL